MWAYMVGSLLNGSQWALPPDMHIFVSLLSGYQPGPLQQNTVKVMRGHIQHIFKDNFTFIYCLSCFSHFVLFQSLVLSLVSLLVSFSFSISILEMGGLLAFWET